MALLVAVAHGASACRCGDTCAVATTLNTVRHVCAVVAVSVLSETAVAGCAGLTVTRGLHTAVTLSVVAALEAVAHSAVSVTAVVVMPVASVIP